MKRKSIFTITILLLMSTWVSAFKGTQWQSTEIAIYQAPNPLQYGLAASTSNLLLRDLYDFSLGVALNVVHSEVELGFLTATLVEASVAQKLDNLFKEVESAVASHSPLKFDGYYSSIQFDHHHFYRITHALLYNEFDHQFSDRLESAHYLYSNAETGLAIEFGLEKAPRDMLLTIAQDKELGQDILLKYQENYIIRIYRTNAIHNTIAPSIEDIMFASTLLGATEQPWLGIPAGNNFLETLIADLESHAQMAVYRNQK